MLDSVALGPLLVGAGWLYRGLWKRRERLYETIGALPGRSSLAAFLAGAGPGLLFASVLPFFWWWVGGWCCTVRSDDDGRFGGCGTGMSSREP